MNCFAPARVHFIPRGFTPFSLVRTQVSDIILCAALSDYDADEICSDIKQLVQETLEKKAESSSGFCMIDTPHALRPREMRTALIEAYHEANDLFCAQHRSGPRFLEGAPSYLGQNPAQRVASLLRIAAGSGLLPQLEPC